MIEIKFYRDDEYVYYNNPNGITRKMTIAEFEALMSGEGGSSDYGGLELVVYDPLTGKINKTWTELNVAFTAGKICYFIVNNSSNEMQDYSVYYLLQVRGSANDSLYYANFYTALVPSEPFLQGMTFTASDASVQMEIE